MGEAVRAPLVGAPTALVAGGLERRARWLMKESEGWRRQSLRSRRWPGRS